jgi:hypothetical protein
MEAKFPGLLSSFLLSQLPDSEPPVVAFELEKRLTTMKGGSEKERTIFRILAIHVVLRIRGRYYDHWKAYIKLHVRLNGKSLTLLAKQPGRLLCSV